MAGRASIVGAAATHVGKVREHNEDSHFLDLEAGLFLVCDGMGGHAAGEVASALAVKTICERWQAEATRKRADVWLKSRTADAKKQLFDVLRGGVIAAHNEIVSEGKKDDAKSGMGTTLVGAMVIGSEVVFAHAGDSRAYLVRDGIAMQLTEDHTLLARLLAAGIDVDVSGEGARFRSMLTNALGIGQECKVSTFVVPLADGDRFLLCSDGISEYVPEAEVGTVLSKQPTPEGAAQRLVELALERGGGDNATAVVVRVVEAGDSPQPAELRRRDDAVIEKCPLWGQKLTPQQRLRALRVAIPRDHAAGDRVPAHTLGDRVAWIVVEGELELDHKQLGPGALLYAESLVADGPSAERDGLAVARTDVRALALRADDFRELCDDDSELGEVLMETVGTLVAGRRRAGRTTRSERADTEVERKRAQSSSEVIEPPPPVLAPLPIGRPTQPALAKEQPAPPKEKEPVKAAPPTQQAKAKAAQLGQPAQRPSQSPLNRPSPLPASLQPAQPTQPSPSQPSPAAKEPEPSPRRSAPRTSPPHPPPGSKPAAPVPKPEPAKPAPKAEAAKPAPNPEAAKPTPQPLASATSFARAVTPTRDSGPISRPPSANPTGPSGLQRPSSAPIARPGTPTSPPVAAEPRQPSQPPQPPPDLEPATDPDLESLRAEIDPGETTSPRRKRAPSEPEIETYYELDAEPPPLPDPDYDDPIEEMTVSMDDGHARVTETVTDTSEATLTVTVTETILDPVRARAATDDEPTRIRRAITAEDSASVSGTISVPSSARRGSRADSWDLDE